MGRLKRQHCSYGHAILIAKKRQSISPSQRPCDLPMLLETLNQVPNVVEANLAGHKEAVGEKRQRCVRR
jgi:hypothetical protein